MDNLFPERRRALKSCHEENSVHKFKETGREDMLLTAVLTLFRIPKPIMLRGPTSSRSVLKIATYMNIKYVAAHYQQEIRWY